MLHVAVVNYNCHFFVNSLLDSLQKTASNDFVFNVCDNGSNEESVSELRRIEKRSKNIQLYFRKQGTCPAGAVHHAEAIEHIISHLDNDDYCFVIDVDCFMFKSKWDEWLNNLLKDSKANAIVTGRSFVTGSSLRANPYMAYFNVEVVRKSGISFKPDLIAGSKERDFGHEMNNLNNLIYILISTPSIVLSGLPKKMISKSMDFIYNGEIIANHLKMGGRGLKDNFFKLWEERCKYYLQSNS